MLDIVNIYDNIFICSITLGGFNMNIIFKILASFGLWSLGLAIVLVSHHIAVTQYDSLVSQLLLIGGTLFVSVMLCLSIQIENINEMEEL